MESKDQNSKWASNTSSLGGKEKCLKNILGACWRAVNTGCGIGPKTRLPRAL